MGLVVKTLMLFTYTTLIWSDWTGPGSGEAASSANCQGREGGRGRPGQHAWHGTKSVTRAGCGCDPPSAGGALCPKTKPSEEASEVMTGATFAAFEIQHSEPVCIAMYSSTFGFMP